VATARAASSVSESKRIAAEQKAEQLSTQLQEAQTKLAEYEAPRQSRANLLRRLAAKNKENTMLQTKLNAERRKSAHLSSRLDAAEACNIEVSQPYLAHALVYSIAFACFLGCAITWQECTEYEHHFTHAI
jgi:chromosome segregation ATPase